MKVSLNWIKEFVDIDVPSPEIADRLSMAGLAVDALVMTGDDWDGVFTAELLKVEKHPNADRLTLCEVKCGEETLSVVCGARNHKVGDKVALAKPGTKLPGGLTIQISEIRKVKSHGMLCSEKELGLAEAAEGILILPQGTPDGLPLREVLPPKDTILDLDITANRGDCLSMKGVAREVATIYRLPLNPRVPQVPPKNPEQDPAIQVTIEAPPACGRYSCRVIRGVKIAPSPLWVQRRLMACGIRPINNVVDATNYTMLETGQPLHAFDLRQIRGGKIIVRFAKEGERFKTLDAQERVLSGNDLVIADAERGLALAGVMGGEDSGVQDDTRDLLLESACFDPTYIRKTSKRLGLQSESSYRFERNVDPNGCAAVLHRLSELIQDWAGAEAIGEIADAYPRPVQELKISLRSKRIARVLGVSLSETEILESLTALGIRFSSRKGDVWEALVPSYRADLTREIDLIEEVARIYGYNRVSASYPRLSVDQMPMAGEERMALADRLRDQLAGWGFCEVLHYSFTSPELLKRFAFSYAPEQVLINPISEELSVLRPSLIPQMVETIRNNVHRGNKNLRLFEIRPVYSFQKNGSPAYLEQWKLSLALSGLRRPLHFLESPEEVSLLDLKGLLTALVGDAGPFETFPPASTQGFLHPKRQAELRFASTRDKEKGGTAGYFGELHPQVLAQWDIPVKVTLAEIIFDFFLTDVKNSIQFKKISPYPGVSRDLNLIVDETITQGEVFRVIQMEAGAWLRTVEFFDLYREPPIPDGKKALTYRIEYGTEERTLTDEEVNAAREKLLKVLKEKVGAYLR